MASANLQRKAFLWLLTAVSFAFGLILLPFYGAVFWGATLAILFAPLNRYLLETFKYRRNLAALATLMLILVIVIIPLIFIISALAREGALVYKMIRSGELDFALYFRQIIDALPPWVVNLLDRFDLDDISELQQRLAESLATFSQVVATHALAIGQNTLAFFISFAIMLYLLFFLLRDGAKLALRIKLAIPLKSDIKRNLLAKFTTVIRATVKGNIVVAITQGALGGLMFWILGIHGALLWGTVMAFLSLLPAIGAGLIWLPVAIYFLVTGALGKGIFVIAFGILVIGLVDNVLRPILVGKDTKMPDYLVLISTLGGISVFGINGFVIGPVIAALFIAAWDLFASVESAPSSAE
jgi:predicted PurR-regulated permease PerM